MGEIFLLNLKVNGIKSISNEIQLDFYKSNLYNFNSEKYKVKGIFGRNAIGKTSIIKAVEIIKDLICYRNYLNENDNQLMLSKLINNKSNKFSLQMDFLYTHKGKNGIISYSIDLIKNDDNTISIYKELIEVKNKKGQVLKFLKVCEGEIKEFNFKLDIKKIKGISQNLLDTRSIINIITEKLKTTDKDYFYFSLLYYIYISKIFVYSQDKDKYENFVKTPLNNEQLEEFTKYIRSRNDLKRCFMTIPKDENILNAIERRNKKKLEFLQEFIPDLKDIEIEKQESKDSYHLDFKFIYKDGSSVDIYFESMGIKNLFSLYDYFLMVYQGDIVFADEIDLSIQDAYLNKLIEFLAKMGEGQFIFTAHNISLLDTLKQFKYSIDFITEKQEIQRWTKKGNASPRTQFKDGMIKNIPFNIDYYDFYNSFEV